MAGRVVPVEIGAGAANRASLWQGDSSVGS